MTQLTKPQGIEGLLSKLEAEAFNPTYDDRMGKWIPLLRVKEVIHAHFAEQPAVDLEALMRAFAADIVKTANKAIEYHTATRIEIPEWVIDQWLKYIPKAEQPAVDGWKSIETAPGDTLGGDIFVAYFNTRGDCCWVKIIRNPIYIPKMMVRPTHWMPVPHIQYPNRQQGI